MINKLYFKNSIVFSFNNINNYNNIKKRLNNFGISRKLLFQFKLTEIIILLFFFC